MFELSEDERVIPHNPLLDVSTEKQLEALHEKLRTERTTVLKAMVKCALTQPDPSRVMIAAKERYEKCVTALDFVEFLQKKLPGWESAVKKE